ncbi:UPF0182 family protein [Nanoarchaeota archaeon]
MDKSEWLKKGIVAIIIVLILSFSRLAHLITEFLWFKNLDFSSIFLISLKAKIFLFLIAAITFFIFAAINLKIASRFHNTEFTYKYKIAAILSIFVAIPISANWFTVLQYFNQVTFNLIDPIFLKDVSFYIFSLPFFLFLWNSLFIILLITTILVTITYFWSFITASFKPQTPENLPESITRFKAKKIFEPLKRKAEMHLVVLASLIFLLLAARHFLSRFSIMYSGQGIVVGAGYSDIVAFLPMINIVVGLAILVAIIFYVWVFYISKEPKLKKRHILGFIVAIYLIFAVVGTTAVPALVQTFRVSPNEINLETPYIKHNIEFTKIAYGLSDVVEKDFPASSKLSAEILDQAPETIDNIRLLDWRPLQQTYKQTQEIRLYYDLSGIDIDRYDINGKYTQVMLAPRELDQNQLVESAKTWVNTHMIYTHGFGLVMSPVNKVTKEGLPDYLIKDVPPTASVSEANLEITNPRIYYGEQENEFVLVNTMTDEFDFPKGDKNEYFRYDGKGGVLLDSFLKKLLMTIRFKDIKIILSSDVTVQSRIMLKRNIRERISTITPFLELDEDPYLVIADGRLVWIQDAYTVSNNFPYSERLGQINYIRNSVKITLDAYNGDITYYVIDKEDPLMATYSNIFPGQFKSYEEMDPVLKEHIRYPVDLFKVQSFIYSTYHMEDPVVFYNKEDAWQVPKEIYGTGQQINVEPYYIIIKLPGEAKEEFVLMSPFTPIKKDNMVSWLAARSDGDNYGNLLLYRFPKDKLLFGPSQIEAKIDQDSEISQQLTLWSQRGSRVTRGNLLVIPIDDSLLYIEPLYLQSEQGQLPELKRVLVSDGTSVVMEEDLATALGVLLGRRPASTQEEFVPEENLAQQANEYYQSVLESMDRGDWAGIGENLDKLGQTLEALK